DRFLEFMAAKDMTMSYKPVMLLSLLDTVEENGRAKLTDVVQRFQQFYRARRAAGLVVERPVRKQQVDELDPVGALRLMRDKPFETFERRGFLRYDRDAAYIRFDPHLWRQLGPDDREQIRTLCLQSIESYYERLRPE